MGALAQAATGSAGARADDEICEAIVSKFEMQPAVSFAEIAKTAWNAGRIRLATKVSKGRNTALVRLLMLAHF